MKTTQSKAYARLIKKLSAVRATLGADERAILDKMIGSESGVTGRKMGANKAVIRVATRAAEVAAHKMSVDKAVSRVAD